MFHIMFPLPCTLLDWCTVVFFATSSTRTSHCLQGFFFVWSLCLHQVFHHNHQCSMRNVLTFLEFFFLSSSTISVLWSSSNFFSFLPWPLMLYDFLWIFFPFYLRHQCSIIFFQKNFLYTSAISVMWFSSKLFSFGYRCSMLFLQKNFLST